jgi:hypothetical protein
MSFKSNDNQQISLSDSFLLTSKRTQKTVLKSWAKDFSEIVIPAINEERFSVLYSNNPASRPICYDIHKNGAARLIFSKVIHRRV